MVDKRKGRAPRRSLRPSHQANTGITRHHGKPPTSWASCASTTNKRRAFVDAAHDEELHAAAVAAAAVQRRAKRAIADAKTAARKLANLATQAAASAGRSVRRRLGSDAAGTGSAAAATAAERRGLLCSDSESESESDDEFEVEAILDEEPFMKVQWKGFDDTTWEPGQELAHTTAFKQWRSRRQSSARASVPVSTAAAPVQPTPVAPGRIDKVKSAVRGMAKWKKRAQRDKGKLKDMSLRYDKEIETLRESVSAASVHSTALRKKYDDAVQECLFLSNINTELNDRCYQWCERRPECNC